MSNRAERGLHIKRLTVMDLEVSEMPEETGY
jgi:hypothetical protein